VPAGTPPPIVLDFTPPASNVSNPFPNGYGQTDAWGRIQGERHYGIAPEHIPAGAA
jgi:hypothetical protein